ncbi:MAG: hypothetical protein WBQ36_09740 [Desulfobaccales bacterium]
MNWTKLGILPNDLTYPIPEEKGSAMNKEKYEEAKIYQKEIYRLLKEGNLSPEERQKLEEIQDQLAGFLMSPWLPVDLIRRAIMICILIIGIYGIIKGYMFIALLWLLLPLFSPRIQGEVLQLIRRLS